MQMEYETELSSQISKIISYLILQINYKKSPLHQIKELGFSFCKK